MAPTTKEKAKVLELGTRKQLLFDRLFLEKSRGIALTVNRPYQEPEPVLTADRPWEKMGLGAYNTAMTDDGRFRMWYYATAREKNRHSRLMLCYAESTDGVNWDKPKVGLLPFNGSKANNIVAPTELNAGMQGGTVCRDDHGPSSERYKLWTKYQACPEENHRGITTGKWAMVSPDGLRWKLLEEEGYPLRRGNAADTQSICFWDEDLKKYVGFVRLKIFPKDRQRTCSAGVLFSDDFRSWTMAKEIFKADRTDETSPVPGGKPDWVPPMDFYTPGGMKVPGVPNAYILLPTAYFHWEKDAFPSNIDIRLATSRDCLKWWQHPSREPFLRLGPDGSASSGMIFSNPFPIPVGEELWLYYAGTGRDHRSRVQSAAGTGLFRARLRQDGFVSADAGIKGGEFTTPVITFSGRRLELNMEGSAGGWLLAEILTPGEKAVASFRLKDCDVVRGNSVKKTVTWKGSRDLSKLAGKPVRLRFVMRSVKLYAFQFSR